MTAVPSSVAEDQNMGALVDELSGEDAQDGRAAAAGAAADQGVRRGVYVDVNDPSVGADADRCCRGGQHLKLLAGRGR